MKNLILSLLMLANYTVAADSSDGRVVVHVFSGLTCEQAREQFYTNSQAYHQCNPASNSALKIFDAATKQQWKITSAILNPPRQIFYNSRSFDVDLKSAGLRSYFITQEARGSYYHEYQLSDSEADRKLYKNPVLKELCSLHVKEVTQRSLTPLSKGLLAAAVVGLGTAAYYANKHNRLTRSVSVNAIMQEQKNSAQLPENQHSEITA